MSSLLPLASFNLELQPFSPEPCQPEDFPVTVRLTLAAINPDAFDDKEEPSTLRILKKSSVFDDSDDEDDDEEFYEDEDDEEVDSEEEKAIAELERLEAEEKETAKTAKKEAKANGEEADKDDEDSEDSEDDEDDEDDEDGIEEHIVCTLSPKLQFQQTLDLTILPDEEVYFVVTGSYAIHLTGNYVEHPFDDDEDDYSGEDSDEEEDSDYDSEDYDLTPDEDEIISGEEFDLDQLDEVDDIEGKIDELVEAESNSKKRSAEEAEEVEAKEAPKQTKKAKKEAAAAAKKEKSVKFNKELEQGPTVTATKKEEKVAAPAKKEVKKEEPKKKMPVKTLAGGVTIEDKTIGSGPVCKKGQKVGVRYIGKLKNGKSFDKNTSGKPFMFGLGKGEVIKGWDLGVAGMAVGGERRIVIPPAMAYGSRKLPGIPSNSELTFDVKLLSIK